ncbi:MAG: class I SAM-dependent methyltransferase [Bacillota bacterium]|nr:class I SAM-dependent methyltransferase [Bacillota bacterium]
MKPILDACCGSRTIWFNKNHPLAIYCDIRDEDHTKRFGATGSERHLHIHPDLICDFTNLPFEDGCFSLVIFDPPHILNLKENAWYRKAYGYLDDNWREIIKAGFDECIRVLKPDGVLIFKWSETSISTRDLIKTIGAEPLIGHRSGKKANTHWLCFMKEAHTE